MIDTIATKNTQWERGFYQVGNGIEGNILIVGSCRTMAFLNYFARLTHDDGNYTVRRIDPCDWTTDPQGKEVDVPAKLLELEHDERITTALKACTIFIHEHLENYGMFNTSRKSDKNIYQFGMNPSVDISIPNFHDHVVLENDYAAFGQPVPDDYVERGEAAIQKFCDVAAMSSFPEFADYFDRNWRRTRFFWRPNHTSAEFTMWIFKQMCARYLNVSLRSEFLREAKEEDLFKNPHTEVTENDRMNYQLSWKD